MEDCPHIDCIDFIELCRQINARPVPWVEMVEVKKGGASASGGPSLSDSKGTPPKSVGELAGILEGLAK